MRSIIQTVASAIRPTNQAPATLPGTRSGGFSRVFGGRGDTEHQLSTMGSVSTLFSVVDLLSSTVASAEWKLYKKARSGKPEDRTEVTSHAAIDLWDQPNPHYDRSLFIETVQQHIELVGEGDMLVGHSPIAATGPLSLWPVRPDYLVPDKHPTEFLVGWIYVSDNGERVPLGLDEVLQLRRPNPLDPWRGMGPVQSLLADLDSVKYSAEWNRNFFANSAEPGGVIEMEDGLQDNELEDLQRHWNAQHKGVRNAHRVAIIERGKWVQRAFSQRDMQFTELRHVSRDTIMEAYRINKFKLGITDDVNRASALAADTQFAKDILEPRLVRWRDLLNRRILPLFGDTARDLEWDFESPIPEDQEQALAELTAKATAAKTWADAGYNANEIAEMLEVPLTADDGLSPQQKATIVQKLYLGVGKLGQPGVLLSTEEGRQILADAGFDIDPAAPLDGSDEGTASAPPGGLPPAEPPGGDLPDDGADLDPRADPASPLYDPDFDPDDEE